MAIAHPRAEMELFSKLRIDPGDYQKPAAESIRDKLTVEQYRVTQENGTERPFSNAFWDQFEKGIYVDIVTGEPLFPPRISWRAAAAGRLSQSPLKRACRGGSLRTTALRHAPHQRCQPRRETPTSGMCSPHDPESPQRRALLHQQRVSPLRPLPRRWMEAEGWDISCTCLRNNSQNTMI